MVTFPLLVLVAGFFVAKDSQHGIESRRGFVQVWRNAAVDIGIKLDGCADELSRL